MALADLPAAGTWTNWVGNQSFTPARFAAPSSAEEVAALVGEAAAQGMGVRVVGAGHSFTPVVQTTGLLLDLSRLSGVVSADPARLRAVARAGTPIHGFYEPLWAQGLALRNQGDIDDQHIAGAVATATHGSGIGNTCFSGVVRGVSLVGPDGSIRRIGEDEPRLLRAAQVSVGTLGVMTELELEVAEAYRLYGAGRRLAVAGGDGPLGRARPRPPALRLLLDAQRGIGRAVQHRGPRRDDRPLLREDLRRGDGRPARQHRARPAHRPLLPHLSDGL